ncbi:membrane protein [Corynebacterium stationis]|nr:membrane protein [Corynebacterium stationis]
MLFIPPLMGLILQPSWAALPLLITWWAGYFTYFAITIWVKGRLRPKHLPPVLTYGAITALAGIAALITQWQLIAWLPIFAPIIVVAVYETIKRRERSLVSGWSTVLAAAMMLPTVASISTNGTPAAVSGDLWWATAWFALYFGGSIYYVKTLIRDFGSRSRFIQSVIFHAIVCVAALGLAFAQPHTWPVAVVGALLAARSYAVPRIAQRRGKRIPPKYVGMVDGVVTVFVVVAAFAAFGS